MTEKHPHTAEQCAIAYLQSAIEALDPAAYLDFLPAPSAETMRENAIRHATKAIDILAKSKGE